MNWRTIRYDGQVDFSGFSSSQPVLNDYLHNKAAQDQADDLCTLYLMVNDQNQVGGYYVLSAGSIRRQELPTAKARKNLPGYPLGTIHIGRLAREQSIVKQQLGTRLIMSAIEVAVASSKTAAAHAITVDAKDKHAEEYYAKHGFENLIHDPTKTTEYPKAMYMKMKDARFALSSKMP